MSVSPTAGSLLVTATKSVLMLPTTIIGFCADNAFLLKITLKGCYKKIGAQAIAVKPPRKKTNIHFKLFFERDGAALNSCQTNTPQQAEIRVAPCPME